MSKINENIVVLSIEDIIPYEGSHKTGATALSLLEESIRRYGVTQPISVDSNHVIVTGNAVYKACVNVGVKEIPCIVLDYLSDDEIKQYRIADNKTGGFAKWNEDKLKRELTYLRDPNDLQFAFDESLANMLGQGFGTGLGTPVTQSAPKKDEGKTAEQLYKEHMEKQAKAEESFRGSLSSVEESMKPQAAEYYEVVCSKCGKTIRIRK